MPEVTVNGLHVGFDVAGDGAPIMCLGGTGMPAMHGNSATRPRCARRDIK